MRKAESGQVIFKDSMSASVAAIVKGDYRGDGADQVVVCAVNGEVRHALALVQLPQCSMLCSGPVKPVELWTWPPHPLMLPDPVV